MSNIASRIADNVAVIRQRISEAARRSGRQAADVTLVAVTKYVDLEAVQAVVAAGCHELGESRPQDLWLRAEALQHQPVRWHLIGHLQRNKARRTLPLVSLFHSGDSLRLLATLSEEAAAVRRLVPVLLEVNISGDATKHGFAPNNMAAVLPEVASLPNLDVRGLMAMAAREGDLDSARRDFIRLRELRDQLRAIAPPSIKLDELSMGMSGDYEVAIEEGATIVRVGSALFEGLPQ